MLIDVNGVRSASASETLDVYNVTAASSLGTIASDTNGIVAAGSFTATAGDVVEFSHASLPGTFRLTLAATQATAYTIKGNNITSYVMENLQTPQTSTIALLYAADTDNPNVEPVLIGSGQSGETVEINFTTTVTKNFRIYAISQNAEQISRTNFDTTAYDDVTVPAAVSAGTYTPTASNTSNLDSTPTMAEAQYMRIGNTVTVSGGFTADVTTTATNTRFDITLPVASNIGAIEDVAGVAFCSGIAGMGAQVLGTAAGDAARIAWYATDVASQQWSYTFTYQVI